MESIPGDTVPITSPKYGAYETHSIFGSPGVNDLSFNESTGDSNMGRKKITFRTDTGFSSDQQRDTITSVLVARPFMNGAQNKIEKGDFVFLFDPKNSISYNSAVSRNVNGHIVVPVNMLNSFIEEGYRENSWKAVEGRGVVRPRALMKNDSKNSSIASTDFLVSSLEIMRSKWHPVGIVHTATSVSNMDRVFTIAVDKITYMPNLWPSACVGDYVGFIIKEVPYPYKHRYNTLGEIIEGGPFPDKILQILPYCSGRNKHPFYLGGSPVCEGAEQGLMFTSTKMSTEISHDFCSDFSKVDNGIFPGMALLDKSPNTDTRQNIVRAVKQFGYWVLVGKVTKVSGALPSQERVLTAMRSTNVYRELWNNEMQVELVALRSDSM